MFQVGNEGALIVHWEKSYIQSDVTKTHDGAIFEVKVKENIFQTTVNACSLIIIG